jgi:hypothetical protein
LSAAADLDHIAELFRVGRLAEKAMIEGLAACGGPLQQLDGAVDRDALLVAGDEERDRPFFWPAIVGGEMVKRRRDHAGDRPLHVDGAAAE